MKETFESIVVAFVFAFVFRAYVVEAFVIPTGSMAPTLLGRHLRVQCNQCGYRFKSDLPDRSLHHVLNRTRYGVCPMCHFPNVLRQGTRPRSGDRILVHKYIYSLSQPRRWDVVVFKNPSGPTDNYIKRLVGLPGESLLIVEGNVYVKPYDQDDSDWRKDSRWRIARKTDGSENPHAIRIQNAVWQPVYHSQYIPLDAGAGPQRFLEQSPYRSEFEWQSPWVDEEGEWLIEGRRSYVHRGSDKGVIRFDFENQFHRKLNWHPYNQFKLEGQRRPIEDVRVGVTFQPAGSDLSVCIRTTARLDQAHRNAKPMTLAARIDAQGRVTLEAPDPDNRDQIRTLDEKNIRPFTPKRNTMVELWYVDQQATVWIDGQQELEWSFDFQDFESVIRRLPLNSDFYPEISIEVEGAPVTLHRIMVDRDMIYTSKNAQGEHGERSSLLKSASGKHRGWPIDILPDQYFCLGDNSPRSADGRVWNSVNPWIEKNMFSDRQHMYGVVPRSLMLGRAFFVYFPAPFPPKRNAPGLFPNFSEMRFIH